MFFDINKLVLFALICVVGRCSVIQNTSSELSLSKEELNGKTLAALGEAFNNTLLKMIGNTIENVQGSLEEELCRFNPCTDWNPWTTCSAQVVGSFGVTMRNRTCWFSASKPCARDGDLMVENESKVCELVCRSDYNISSNKFCVKIYTNKVTHPDAEKQCQRDGGHLMNPDTQNSWNDFEEIAKEVKTLGNIWIDGTRTSVGSSWNFRRGLNMENSTLGSKWKSGQPTNGSTELCLLTGVSNNVRYLYDNSCSYPTSFVCELSFRL